jgi:hypothetical protein
MISLLVAIFGKNHIPPYVRYGLIVIGLAALIYRLRKLWIETKPKPEIEITVQPKQSPIEVKQPAPQLGLIKYMHGYQKTI